MANILSYEEFKKSRVKYGPECKCYVGGCNEPGLYEGGDARFWCGMCEEHASLRSRYRLYLHCIISDAEKALTGEELYEKALERQNRMEAKLNEELEKQYGRESCET